MESSAVEPTIKTLMLNFYCTGDDKASPNQQTHQDIPRVVGAAIFSSIVERFSGRRHVLILHFSWQVKFQ
jgi:hypothetical protein